MPTKHKIFGTFTLLQSLDFGSINHFKKAIEIWVHSFKCALPCAENFQSVTVSVLWTSRYQKQEDLQSSMLDCYV